ncbi:hypothetical protein HO173_003227 [Letharia columbiana]|uniref:Uncharacterized protein n=1 Tax=Letharia columbiana TaxID=112416 RepID=A0A8H6L7U0_9LECA|nr:uncharacterized protein HO173_003227 [Letharia columbiana]KAF6238721.1 hypothetical protein HO173_003227 [Letharia columbiana]
MTSGEKAPDPVEPCCTSVQDQEPSFVPLETNESDEILAALRGEYDGDIGDDKVVILSEEELAMLKAIQPNREEVDDDASELDENLLRCLKEDEASDEDDDENPEFERR